MLKRKVVPVPLLLILIFILNGCSGAFMSGSSKALAPKFTQKSTWTKMSVDSTGIKSNYKKKTIENAINKKLWQSDIDKQFYFVTVRKESSAKLAKEFSKDAIYQELSIILNSKTFANDPKFSPLKAKLGNLKLDPFFNKSHLIKKGSNISTPRRYRGITITHIKL